jgi:hypothetical protein
VCLKEIGPVSHLGGFGTVNLGSHASYRYDARGLLPMDLVVTTSIKALIGV